jgi:cytochrome c
MDSFEWNKIAGAVLGTLLFVVAVKIAAGFIFEVEPPAKPGYVVQGVAEPTGTGTTQAAAAEEQIPDWGTVLPKADVSAGKATSTKCEQCHDLSKGGPNKIGPNLWGVVGRPRASHPGFDYSAAMKSKGGSWTYDELFKFLKSPGAYIPGTKMTFAGLRSPDDRVNLIAYLRTQSDNPVPIPPPQPAKAAPAAVPANGKAPAAAPGPGAATTTSGKLSPQTQHGDFVPTKGPAAATTGQGPNGVNAVTPANTPPPSATNMGGASNTAPIAPAPGKSPPAQEDKEQQGSSTPPKKP